jgi:benzil reductase ((S)-benzoin forming)
MDIGGLNRMKYYIITGASRGIGEALVEQLLVQGNQIFCISRNRNEKLIEQANNLQVQLDYIEFDLTQVHEIDSMIKNIFLRIDQESVETITLINNAGIVTPIKPIEWCTSDEIIRNTQINMTAPMILTAHFIALASEMKTDKQIINISSGAGKKPYDGWSNYCSTKAGLDLFTRCVGLEQSTKEFPVRVLSIAPGVVDTDMQKEIRMTPKEHFHNLDRFVALKDEGLLLTPQAVAAAIVKIMDNKEITNGALLDIRDQ